jgi:prepilin-type N-terminal cleavage/methylation domain-containing protein
MKRAHLSARRGFTLLEVMAVVVIIGILAMLGWVSLSELIQTNKAKETSRLMAAFVERAIAEGKMHKDTTKIFIVNGSTIQVRFMTNNTIALPNETLPNGFSKTSAATDKPAACGNIVDTIKAVVRIGTSGVDGTPCFVACNARGYCGGAVKETGKNYFTAWLKKKSTNAWEAL